MTSTQHVFLSDGWIDAAKSLRAEFEDRIPAMTTVVRVNQIIKSVPFGEGVIHAYVDTSSGVLDVEIGLLESPDATVTLEYDIARKLLVEGDFQAVIGAFMAGKVTIQGDMIKLMSLGQGVGAGAPDETEVSKLQLRIREITID
jgi:hypothetical protein